MEIKVESSNQGAPIGSPVWFQRVCLQFFPDEGVNDP